MNDSAQRFLVFIKFAFTNFFQVTTVTKVVREVSHMEPDPGAMSYMSVPLMSQEYPGLCLKIILIC